MVYTFCNDILDRLALFAHEQSLILFTQLWKDQRSDGSDDAWEDRIARVQEPS